MHIYIVHQIYVYVVPEITDDKRAYISSHAVGKWPVVGRIGSL